MRAPCVVVGIPDLPPTIVRVWDFIEDLPGQPIRQGLFECIEGHVGALCTALVREEIDCEQYLEVSAYLNAVFSGLRARDRDIVEAKQRQWEEAKRRYSRLWG